MREPQRTCVVCRKVIDKKDLLRIVKTPDLTIEIDKTGRKNGRGAYICKDEVCFERLKKTKGLERSFKQPISLEVYDRLLEEVKSL